MKIRDLLEQGRDYAARGYSRVDPKGGNPQASLDPYPDPPASSAPATTSAGINTGSGSTRNNDTDTRNSPETIGGEIDTNAPSGSVRPNPNMNPLFSMDGASRLTRRNAARVMQSDTLPRARAMAGYFGSTITINDAIAKAGTSRERNTPGSQHFRGTALDISTAGMSDEDKIRLFRSALQAGFTGFGFGNNILHVDTGPVRHWSYGNSYYGGQSVANLGSMVRSRTTQIA